jgi:hypothetical protein
VPGLHEDSGPEPGVFQDGKRTMAELDRYVSVREFVANAIAGGVRGTVISVEK